jgi:hypothetical protein
MDAEVPDLVIEVFEGFEGEGGGFGEFALGMLDGFEGPIEHEIGEGGDNFLGIFDHIDAVTDHGEIVAGGDSGFDGVVEADFIEDGSHVEIVGHDEAAIVQLVSEELGDDILGERGGPPFFGIEAGIPGVADHD